MELIHFEASINPSKQGFKMSGDGSATLVLELDALSAINYAAFYANACMKGGTLDVTINLIPVKVYK
jgi:hypothetical protein